MSEDEEGGDMGRPADGVLFRPLPIPDVAWMLDRVPVMGEDDRSGVTGPADCTRINADVRRTNTEELDEPEEREKERPDLAAKDHKASPLHADWLLLGFNSAFTTCSQ